MKARYVFAVVLVLFGVALACACAGVQEEVVTPFQEVRTEGSRGSGTVIKLGDEVLVLTAAHVVEDAHKDGKPITLYRDSGKRAVSINATVVHYSAPEESGGDDLALLKPADATGLTPAMLWGEELLPDVGTEVYYIGSPAGLHGSLEKSIINKREHFARIGKKRQKMFVVNGNGWFGSSGGGVYTRDNKYHYRLIGVVTRAVTNSPKTPLGCEHPETIKRFLASYKKGGK